MFRKALGKNKKETKPIIVNPNLLYAEIEIWSPQNSLWTRYRVSKPRLPKEDDVSQKWSELPSNAPKSFSTFIGNHNNDYFNQLNHKIELFESSFNLPDVLCIFGPGGSGKSSSMKIFQSRLIDEQNLSIQQGNKWCLFVDIKSFLNDISVLWSKINKFAEPPLEKYFGSSFRLIIFDNADLITPSNQQSLKKIMQTFMQKLRYILITSIDPREALIAFVMQKAEIIKTKSISERDALSVILSICHRNKIGYNLEGIRGIFNICNKPNEVNLTKIINTVQEVFIKTHFVSKENAYKESGLEIEPLIIPPCRAIEPFQRCSICTLFPPCKHQTMEILHENGLKRRKELPRYKDGSMTCPEFFRTGCCSSFNKYGHCSLDHPKNLHKIEYPVRRCPQCTIPWPCNHCAYHAQRNTLKGIIEELKLRIGRLRQLNVPEPPLSFVKQLEKIQGWKDEVARIDRAYINNHTSNILKTTQEWVDNSYSTSSSAYQNRCKILLDSFGDLYTSDLLNAHRGSTPQKGIRNPKKETV